MKKFLFLSAFAVAITASFAFSPSAEKVNSRPFTDITLYNKVTGCPSIVCGDYPTHAVCTDLFQTAVTCVTAYTGDARRKN